MGMEEARKLAEEVLGKPNDKASLVKSLFFGRFSNDRLPLLPNLDPLPLLEKLHSIGIDPVQIDRDQNIPDHVIKSLGNLGLLGLTIPESYGGGGASQSTYCRLMEELGALCASTAIFVNAHQSIGLKAILLFGTEEQKRKWLPPLASGEKIAAFSLTEPMAGSDAGGIQTKAVWDSEKKGYILNGTKQWTTNGSIASVLTVMAKTKMEDGKEKVSAFLVPSDSPGLTFTAKALEKVGIRGTRTSNLKFENVFVPQENLLGKLGSGLKVCLTTLDFGRTTFGATCTGLSKKLLEMAKKQAIERIQFGKPLAHFEMVQYKLAKIAAYAAATEATTQLTAALVDQGLEDVMLEAAILKVFASESLWEMIYETMQIFGGRSFFTDLPLERMMRDARLNMIGEGANEVLRVFIGAVGLREVGEALKNPRKWGTFLSQCQLMKGNEKVVMGLQKRIRLFSWQVLYTLARYREGVVEEQFVINRLASKVISLYTLMALLWKGGDKNIIDLYASLAFEQFDHPFIPSHLDPLIKKVANDMTGID